MGLYGPYKTYDEFLLYADFDVYDDPEIEPEKDVVFVDGEQEEIEEKYGCKIEDMSEDQLIEVAEKKTCIPGYIVAAEWDPDWQGIQYEFYYEE